MSTSASPCQDVRAEKFGVNQEFGDRPAAKLHPIHAQRDGQRACLGRGRKETPLLQKRNRARGQAAGARQFDRAEAESAAALRNKV